MSVLVTGAQGFTGRFLIARWLEVDPGIKIIGCGRSPAMGETFTHAISIGDRRRLAPLPPLLRAAAADPRCRYLTANLLHRQALASLIRDVRPDIIVHLASGLRDDETNKLLETNVVGTENLYGAVAALGLARPPRIIIGSSGSVYGAVADEALPIAEETPSSPFDMYSISKVAQEQVAWMLSKRFDIPTAVVRIFNIIGPGQDERHFCGHIATQLVDIEKGRRAPAVSIGPLTTTRDFVDVRDVADGLIAAATRGASGTTYNLGSGREVTMQEVFDEMIALARLPTNLRILLKPARKADMPRNVAAIGRITTCGYAPRFTLRNSLGDVLDYYRSLADGTR